MHSLLKSFLIGAVLCAATVSSAKAEIFYIEDQVNRFSVSFPDLWAVVNDQKPDDKLTVAAPGANSHATCRVRVREDRRFLIYPRKFASPIQHLHYSQDFWNAYFGEYNDVNVDVFKDDAGLGRGFASYAEASYTTADGPIVRKRGIMFATLYRDRAYIVDCAAEESVYDRWRPSFLSIVKSIDFDKVIDEFPQGNYRNFLADDDLVVNGPNPLDQSRY